MRFSNKGFSLVEVMIASGIMAVVALGFMQLITQQFKDAKGVGELISAQTLLQSMSTSLANGKVCKYILNTKTFNAFSVISGAPVSIDLGSEPIFANINDSGTPGLTLIKKGDVATPYSSSVVVESIIF